MDDRRTDPWVSAAAYERFIGRWSRPVARKFLQWLAPNARRVCLDVGCGTGALTASVLSHADPAWIAAVDPSVPFLSHGRLHVSDPRARFVAGDARSLPWVSSTFELVVSGLMINFVQPPSAAVAEMARVAKPGELIAAYVWDYADGMQLLRHFWNAAIDLDPGAIELDEGRRFPVCQRSALDELFRSAHLCHVDTASIEVATRFSDFDDCWSPFLGGQGPGPAYVTGLDEAGLTRLRDRFRAMLPVAPNGSIELSARAWAVRGSRPA